jgi:hypothetical protein
MLFNPFYLGITGLSRPKQRGPPDSPFAGGEYHGVLLFPSEYPFKPPGIKVLFKSGLIPNLNSLRYQMLTPSGRFQPSKKICFSMSDFHPGSVRSLSRILTCTITHPPVMFTVESRLERGYHVCIVLPLYPPSSFGNHYPDTFFCSSSSD